MEFQIPSQNRKCRPLLFKDLLFSISFSVCHGDTVVVKRNCRDDASRVSDTECLKSSLPLSLLTNTDFIEEHSILGASKPEELVQEVGHLEDGSKPHGVICVESLVPAIDLQGSKSGVGVEDYMQVVPVEKSLFDLNDHEKILEEESSDHTSLLKNLEHQSYKFLESSADRTSAQSFLPIDAMENRDNGSAVDNYIDKVPSGCNTSVNGSLSSLVTSDILNKMNSSLTNLSKIHVRQEPGHGPYNYASDSKGAKILASNKEAKGASNILNKDEDKYFRAPCNIGSKYVDIELSEETLVVEIVMANHEFYSSNVREFALWGSLIYPTDEWVSLGKFEAENNRASQIFRLKEPQWVRYLKLQMLSHYGSDFYCTMSMVEVHGIDAIEWILEDWIAEDTGGLGYQLSSFKSEDCSHVEKARMSISLSKSQVLSEETNNEEKIDTMLNQSLDAPARELAVISDGKMRNADISEPVHHQIGRPGLDSVMKLLMQKVRTLEQKQPSLSHSLEELDVRQRNIFGVQNYELKMIISKMENVTSEVANLSLLLQYMEEEQEREIQRLEECVLDWINAWNADLEFLR
ncbi:hypothetical protein KP509_22G063700 [Ceratopteris richardii]|uniref:SUN domain-containing protein n=1 Tax=Ceratopteris richardii TaxID=49495 RepID=A0A8T2S5V8_CERRI|nr:hypothetical protein KP509_22G063700 [Ceratopteris richardii]